MEATMTEREAIAGFLAARTVALVGASRSASSFSAAVRRELEARGYRVLPVNSAGAPEHFASIAAIPEKVDAALVMVPHAAAEAVVREALAAGVTRIWLHQGSVSPAAATAAAGAEGGAVVGRCILMFLEPVRSVHRFHRALTRLFGRLP
jgi:uncharacterized protein